MIDNIHITVYQFGTGGRTSDERGCVLEIIRKTNMNGEAIIADWWLSQFYGRTLVNMMLERWGFADPAR